MTTESYEKLDMFDLRMIRKETGYRYSLDPFLLARFARIKPGDVVADLGTATGIVPLVLARTAGAASICGIDIQQPLVDLANRNRELNSLGDRVRFCRQDLADIRNSNLLAVESCSVVLSNPPYRKPGTGKIADDPERALGRHEIAGGLDVFLDAASYLLANRGRCYFIFLAERLDELLREMTQFRLQPKRMRCVHSRPGVGAHLVLVEGQKNVRPGMKVEPPLYIYGADGEYSEEIRSLYRGNDRAE